MRARFFSIFIHLALFAASFCLVDQALAQSVNVGIEPISNAISLSATDPRIIVARVINIALLFLGVIAVGLIIYAGFLWMTSGGNEDKIDQAKRTLRNAVIGLIIILSSWGIATFILNRLIGATGINGIFNNSNFAQPALSGAGAIGACTVERVYPEDGQDGVPRNTAIMVSFKEPIRLDSVCQDAAGQDCDCSESCNLINPENIRIFRDDLGDSDSTNVTRAVIAGSDDRRQFVITPMDFLGSPEGEFDYSVRLTNGIKKDSGDSIFKTCRDDFLQWGFEVSTNVDLTPPQVARGGIFPLPDNGKDIYGVSQVATPATAAIQMIACPSTYQPAAVLSVTRKAGDNDASAVIDSNYHSAFSIFTVVTTADNTKAQLFSGATMLGAADWSGNTVTFNGFFVLTAEAHVAGNAWDINVRPEVLADTLAVGNEVYNFAATSTGNNILVSGPACAIEDVATAIHAKLSGHPDVDVDKVGARVILTAKVAGASGNNIILTTSNPAAVAVTPFKDGKDLVRQEEIADKQDRPMNSIVQINFNEAVNPLMLSGTAAEVASNIRIVNAEASASAGAACTKDSDCLSFDCEAGTCKNNFLSGKFLVSNAYRTVEFISDKECGVNGCGEKIYCLPANSHLEVQLVSANLRSCSTNNDCLYYQPFTLCSDNGLGGKVCRDPGGKNYPVADPTALDGIVDAAINSLDGNRDIYADGPIAFYNENNGDDLTLKDKYKWSFYVNDQIMTDPPQITSILPVNGAADIAINQPIEIRFNTLMMNDSLRTGTISVNNGQNTVEHHLLNLFSTSPTPMGYWVSADNRDIAPLDGEPDLTYAYINHTRLAPSVSYKSQAGSGVKDIYQNCYKPSAGAGCNADGLNPSCCYGQPVQLLGEDGNCL